MTRFASIDEFYTTRGGKYSGESDFGVHWYEAHDATPVPRGLLGTSGIQARFRVSVVHDTGDIYAIKFWDNTVELLGTIPTHCDAPDFRSHPAECAYEITDKLFEGWAQDGAKPLSWIRERILDAVRA